jgi:hypothetical protein
VRAPTPQLNFLIRPKHKGERCPPAGPERHILSIDTLREMSESESEQAASSADKGLEEQG